MDPVRIDIPIAGFYQTRLIKGGPWVAVRIWWGFPSELTPEETVDRLPAWNAERDGKPVGILEVWPHVSGRPIPESEYKFLLARAAHASRYLPDSPFAQPRRRVDMNKAPPPIFRKP
jgi:hypothetical protein